jgi:hypothetical protein
MTHEEFVAAYREGKLAVQVDPKAAARLVSNQMMLPFILLPFFGVAVALALVGYLVAAATLFVATLGFRYFVRSTSSGFVLRRALGDAAFYEQAVSARILSAYSRDSS